MSNPPFVHLHCHSHYSLLDGAGTVDRLLERARQLCMNALALTDHGNLYGALEFYQKALEKGIKPIIGYEAYLAPGSRFAREGSMREASTHLTLLAINAAGYRNLLKLASAAFLEGFYYRPRIDKELLAKHNEGLVCLSGCASGEMNRILAAKDDPDVRAACEAAAWYRDLFGDRFFIEIQNNHIEIHRQLLPGQVQVAKRLDVPMVATNDVHYVLPEDCDAQDVLMCVNTGKYRADANRMRMDGREYYMRSPQEMYAAFPGLEDAVTRTQQIADWADLDLELGKRHFPRFVPPDGSSPEEFLRRLCLEGLKERYRGDPRRLKNGELAPEVKERLERELHVIETLGFPNYFLIVWDFVRFARSRGIQATARGSGVGSLVGFALHLSHVCPLEYDLLFERFLDLSRREAPDIDIDFCQERREEVIQYVKEKYGQENVAQICTFNTLAARAAIRDVGRVLGLPIAFVNEVTALVPNTPHMTIEKALQLSEDLRRRYESDAQVREVINYARQIEGLARNVGTHAAAVVIADRPLIDYLPLQRIQGKEEIITQWEMGCVEKAGLLKMDFLGLRNLTILSKVIALIEQTTGRRVDPYEFPLDDPATFELLRRGETKGVFQLESGGIRELLQRMKPDDIRDIIAVNALYRPGPLEGGMVDDYLQVKHGRKQAEYAHPVMKEILEETHGVMVYQEQVMRILNRLGGIELAEAYTCIKAISKKKHDKIAKYREDFVKGACAQGLAKSAAEGLFNLIEKFAGYGFNKSHSTAYARIAYITAYLKAHHPLEFMAALLSSDITNRNFTRKDSLVEHLEDCHRMGLEVVPPDVNLSEAEFSVNEGRIVFGLSAVKGCGGAAAEAVVAERLRNGPYRSLFDFCERLEQSAVNRTAIESLIKAGAFDRLGGNRAQWTAVLDRAIQHGSAAAEDRRRGQRSLFESDEGAAEASAEITLPDVPDWSEREKLAHEKEVLGFYFSSHPLREYEQKLRRYCSHVTADLAQLGEGAEAAVGGVVSAVNVKLTRNPRPDAPNKFAMFDLEDTSGIVRCIMWPEAYARYGEYLAGDRVVAALGTIDKRGGGDEFNLIVQELIPVEDLEKRFARGIQLQLIEGRDPCETLDNLYRTIKLYPGRGELQLLLVLRDGRQVVMDCRGLGVALDSELAARLEDILGMGRVRRLAVRLGNGRNGHSRGAPAGRGNGNRFQGKRPPGNGANGSSRGRK
ncbi:MAG: DNA polymerase III subunit alpha [Thermogutta sp.]|nr:DNA polymerase III subunit alpha [Thermogutta sp.]